MLLTLFSIVLLFAHEQHIFAIRTQHPGRLDRGWSGSVGCGVICIGLVGCGGPAWLLMGINMKSEVNRNQKAINKLDILIDMYDGTPAACCDGLRELLAERERILQRHPSRGTLADSKDAREFYQAAC